MARRRRADTEEIAAALKQVLGLSVEMIELSNQAATATDDVGSAIVFGTLRDSGYKLRRLARAELERLGHGEIEEEPAASPAPPTQPFSDGPSWPRSEAASPSRVWEGKKILIVDDEPDVLEYLAAWFRDRGFTAVTAVDGREAVAVAAAEQPDLITLDMSMPGRSGIDVFRHLKESPELGGIPVIVITALGDPRRRFAEERPERGEPEAFLSKPIDLQDLAGLVRRLV